jgi:hypothetical protein
MNVIGKTAQEHKMLFTSYYIYAKFQWFLIKLDGGVYAKCSGKSK